MRAEIRAFCFALLCKMCLCLNIEPGNYLGSEFKVVPLFVCQSNVFVFEFFYLKLKKKLNKQKNINQIFWPFLGLPSMG